MQVACRSLTTSRVGSRIEIVPMLEYRFSASRIDAHRSAVTTKGAEAIVDTEINGRPDASNSVEPFFAAIVCS